VKEKMPKIILIILMFAASASAKKKVDLAEYPLIAQVISYEHETFVSRVEATIDGTTYILNTTNMILGHRCHASSMKTNVSIQAGTDYPAKRFRAHQSDWFQFVIPDEQHPLCDLQVVGTKKPETQK
jgi:hypothetical protein